MLTQILADRKYILLFTLLILFFIQGCERDNPSEPIDDNMVPAAPNGLSVFRASDGEVGIEWTQNLENDIQKYNIYRRDESEIQFDLVGAVTALYFIEVGLEYNKKYIYQITAVDFSGLESEPSDTVSAVPQNLRLPLPPYYITINGRNWNDSLSVKISFAPSFSSDVDHYEIYRSESSGFEPDSTNLITKVDTTNFTDNEELFLLTEYYYKIISVDKGGLKSETSSEFSDVILDSPAAIFPKDNASVDYFSEFLIKTCSRPAKYKIVLQTNELYGTIAEFNFYSQALSDTLSVQITNLTFDAYDDYYWRIFSYTESSTDPNSFSELNKFIIKPGSN